MAVYQPESEGERTYVYRIVACNLGVYQYCGIKSPLHFVLHYSRSYCCTFYDGGGKVKVRTGEAVGTRACLR